MDGYKRQHTHVIHAPLLAPKASRHAGSRAWKNSSGWKKVARYQALTRRMMKISRRGTGERRGLALNEADGARLWPAMISGELTEDLASCVLVVDLEVPLGEKRVVDAGLQGLQGALEGDWWPKLPVWFGSRGAVIDSWH